jgi:glycosyltransferase involved in cell wall biosynthesis
MRFVLATPEYPPHAGGGIARLYAMLTPALARAGCEVHVIVASPFSDEFASYEHDGVRVQCVRRQLIQQRADEMAHLSAAPTYRQWLAAARAARDVAATLAPDCVETTDFGLQFVPFVADGFPAPVIVQCHGSLGQISDHEPRWPELDLDLALARVTEATILPHADEVQTFAVANAREWEARLGRPVRVIDPPLAAANATLDDDLPTADEGLVVGRIQAWKGPEVLCQALRRAPGVPRITWIGRDTDTAPDGGSLHEYLSLQYSDVWGSRIAVAGARSHAEVTAEQRRVRVAIVPSLWDVYNLTAAEAMLAGRVVVCSEGAGASDLIESGVNGFSTTAGDAESLADALASALALDAREAAAMGSRARETAIARLDPDASAAARIEAARALVRRPPASVEVPDWVRGFMSGHDSARVNRAFLDQISLRDLSRYLGRRAGGRLLARVGALASRSGS